MTAYRVYGQSDGNANWGQSYLGLIAGESLEAAHEDAAQRLQPLGVRVACLVPAGQAPNEEEEDAAFARLQQTHPNHRHVVAAAALVRPPLEPPATIETCVASIVQLTAEIDRLVKMRAAGETYDDVFGLPCQVTAGTIQSQADLLAQLAQSLSRLLSANPS